MPPAQLPLVRVSDVDPRIRVDLRYASERNFLGRAIYGESVKDAWLRRETAVKLAKAQERLTALGSGLLVWDAYRPPSAQRALWAACPDPRVVAPPERGSRHSRGAAVDVTLVDAAGEPLEMASDFDDFTAARPAEILRGTGVVSRHLERLRTAMEEAGFEALSTEWWHFDDADWRAYPLLDWEPGEAERAGSAGEGDRDGG